MLKGLVVSQRLKRIVTLRSLPPKRAARDKEKGCAKCRWKPKGCGQCRQWAEEGLHGYYFQDDEVIAGG